MLHVHHRTTLLPALLLPLRGLGGLTHPGTRARAQKKPGKQPYSGRHFQKTNELTI